MPRRSAWEPGNVFEVALSRDGFAYGMVIESPLVAFFDYRFTERPPVTDIVSCPIAFRIWIMRSCLGKGGWPVIGFASVPDALQQSPDFYKFDAITRRFSLYRGHTEEPATREQCLGLECAAVWSRNHVESRLDDRFSGRPNPFAESLSAARSS